METTYTVESLQANIQHRLDIADDNQWHYGYTWYQSAHDQIASTAKSLDCRLEVFAGIVAVLSPGVRWSHNIKAAVAVVQYGSKAVTPAYNRNQSKALLLYETCNIDLITGPKVYAFWRTLVDPTHNHPVMDRWALRAAGLSTNSGFGSLRKALQYAVTLAYKWAAQENGLYVSQCQAIAWTVERGGHD